jgi:hypothetical protein
MWDSMIPSVLMDDAVVRQVTLNLTTTVSAILPRNPQRFALVLPSQLSNNVQFLLAEQQPLTTQTGWIYGANAGPWFLGRFMVGDYLTWPLWGCAAVGTNQTILVEVSYNNAAWAKYMAMRDKFYGGQE